MGKRSTSERLKQLMSEKNLKQIDILDKCRPYCIKYNEKINKSHLSQWVSGKALPNQRKLTILSQALQVSEVWLMGYEDTPKADIENVVNGNPVEHLRLASLYEKLNDKKKKDLFEIIELLEYADDSKVEAIKMLLR